MNKRLCTLSPLSNGTALSSMPHGVHFVPVDGESVRETVALVAEYLWEHGRRTIVSVVYDDDDTLTFVSSSPSYLGDLEEIALEAQK